ncbi:flagellar basal body P-ring formation protein FlgA [Roseovarius sp. LXJ103]|uniref:flagellar basal body P-ring formation chaperone FlgA n=1 Tax=Roseovarius carneus TaxID=2853164 RepID=UPI000D604B9C|nr:flagellar basal body P-ring formation chaperone FlgA [Roseovarius carneus]MBZ8117539.1 flagellar basal body P-ring formation protein FlgA [Roseovarius carneus]PWE36666.1 flagella basal body P-ring formation protein FlgA [Pelagicola sp. LXJ1103]
MRALALIGCLLAGPTMAETVLAARTIRAQSLITPQDLVVKDIDVLGAFSAPADIVGQEARVALYAGRPIRHGDIGPPALVERNQIISLIYDQSGLSITTEGRSLSRAGPGEYVRVMNMTSRITVSGRVLPDGRVLVSN